MQIFFNCFWLTVTAMKINRGTEKWVLRVDEVEKELYIGAGDVSEKTTVYLTISQAYAWQI